MVIHCSEIVVNVSSDEPIRETLKHAELAWLDQFPVATIEADADELLAVSGEQSIIEVEEILSVGAKKSFRGNLDALFDAVRPDLVERLEKGVEESSFGGFAAEDVVVDIDVQNNIGGLERGRQVDTVTQQLDSAAALPFMRRQEVLARLHRERARVFVADLGDRIAAIAAMNRVHFQPSIGHDPACKLDLGVA